MTAHNFLFISGATSLNVANYLYTLTITEDLKNNLNSMNQEAKKKKKIRRHAFEQLRDFIQLHSMAKQLVKQKWFWNILYHFSLRIF